MKDIDLEERILCTILQYPESFKAFSAITPEAFSDELNRKIFNEIININASNEPINTPRLSLKIGNPKHLAGLLAKPTILDTATAVEVLQELWVRRKIDSIARGAVYTLESGGSSADALNALKMINSDEMAHRQTLGMRSSVEVTQDVLNDLLEDVRPFSTGIDKLDDAMGGGLYPKKAYGIAARKKVGKTIMLGTISHNLNVAGVKHLFICGEMGEREIQQRVLSRVLQIYPSAFTSGYAERPEVIYRIKEYMRNAPSNCIYYDAPGINFDKLKRAVVNAHTKYEIQGFILDYWQLVSGKDGRTPESYHLGEVAQWIAEIGRKLGIFSITAAQINQDGNTRGGEGMRLAFDQVYHLQPVGDGDGDVTLPSRWLEMMDTRYTPWMNIGSKDYAGLMLNDKGLFFE